MADLVSRLKTELTRSPKKTAILGIGLVVAAVFWGRMLWKPSDEVASAPETSPTSAQSAPVVISIPPSRSLLSSGNAGPSTTGPGDPTWGDLLVWMRSSFEADSIDSNSDLGRDPFNASDPTLALLSLTEEPEPEADADETAEVEEEVAPAPDPGREAAQAMTVQGILKIGVQRFVRLAGRTLATGESFEITGVTDANGHLETWVVLEIESDGALIRRSTGGDPVRLSLPKSDLSGIRIHTPGSD
ncbi:MAG TPA: hypothetical protein VGN57_16710 [Pirellulaceae bacterium]|nr:hypothetical protein [Pirellulaceae bacterium]